MREKAHRLPRIDGSHLTLADVRLDHGRMLRDDAHQEMARIHPAPGREVRGHVADDSGLSRAHVLTLGVLAHRLLFRLRAPGARAGPGSFPAAGGWRVAARVPTAPR